MKLNSNTVILEDAELNNLLGLTEDIAKKNDVFNVGEANIVLDPSQGSINFKTILNEE